MADRFHRSIYAESRSPPRPGTASILLDARAAGWTKGPGEGASHAAQRRRTRGSVFLTLLPIFACALELGRRARRPGRRLKEAATQPGRRGSSFDPALSDRRRRRRSCGQPSPWVPNATVPDYLGSPPSKGADCIIIGLGMHSGRGVARRQVRAAQDRLTIHGCTSRADLQSRSASQNGDRNCFRDLF